MAIRKRKSKHAVTTEDSYGQEHDHGFVLVQSDSHESEMRASITLVTERGDSDAFREELDALVQRYAI